MDIEFMYRQIEVAKAQAAISYRKSDQNKKKGDEEAYMVYLVRAHALRAFTKQLQDKINKHKQKQAKKEKQNVQANS